MKVLSHIDCLQAVARDVRRPCVYASFDPDIEFDELVEAAPWLGQLTADKESQRLLLDGSGIVVCDDVEEQRRIFASTVGDDGPTATNQYEGHARVYVLTCSSTGNLLTENT